MTRLLALAAAVLGLLAAAPAAAAPAQAQSGTRIHLLHGIPGTPVDVAAGGQDVITGFEFGETEDLSALAGQTLTGVQVEAAGTDTVAIDAGDVTLPASGNHAIVAHLDAAGTPTLTVFTNDTSAVPAGQGGSSSATARPRRRSTCGPGARWCSPTWRTPPRPRPTCRPGSSRPRW